MFMYEKNSAVTTVNAARQKLFPQRCKAINTYVSPQSTKAAISIRLGMDQRQPRKPLWTTLRQAEDSYYEPIHCGFKQDCKSRCKCAAANLPCTALRYFGGDCKAEQLDDRIRIFQPILWELLQLHFCSGYEFTQSFQNIGLIAPSELIVCIFLEGSIKTHISPFHTSTAHP